MSAGTWRRFATAELAQSHYGLRPGYVPELAM
jgi:hypothetical protein